MTAASQSRIIHSVIFNLKHALGSEEARRFLEDGQRILRAIPVVEDFVVNLQTSPKNDYQYGFSMAFADQDAYDAYNAHPLHEAFVRERWETEVERFLEIDYVQWS
ncbi:Stress responsive alpha-beta barrel domain protein [Paenibacillus curdlanolyticus YK9]|uniref:Stress responsive alpha-beta barrel domain protein n=1 Tax=Paenibacillus curdlanolyticus YK9 TaxID=717606 RepID=E0IDG8_9BACL|nr:Dabb family protein [Paenibacillus curdlanolyticus]EFM09623.1 Stress responsive alpha-beta barrel domain protein [Paenibacillus curdlanolyticus YK9]